LDFRSLLHCAAVPGIRGAVEFVKKQWRSIICDVKVEAKERNAKQSAAGPKVIMASKPDMVESVKRRLNKLNGLNELNRLPGWALRGERKRFRVSQKKRAVRITIADQAAK
jgi:hypothetical protein